MKKFKNLVIGGIESKVLNLILITVIVITAAFVGATVYHSRLLTTLSTENNEKQEQALTEITSGVMTQVVDQSLDTITQLNARLTDEMFHNLAVRVGMMGEYAGKLFVLDGANRAYKSVYYNADFYREYLTAWDVTICASAGNSFRIAVNTRALGEALRNDENVTYLQYNMGHNDMKALYGYVFGGLEMPDPEEINDLYGRKAGK